MIVEKALEKTPSDRYQSTRDLVVDLRRLTRQSGESSIPTTVTPAAGTQAGTKLTWKNRAVTTLILFALLLAGMLLWRYERPAPQSSRQVIQFDHGGPPRRLRGPIRGPCRGDSRASVSQHAPGGFGESSARAERCCCWRSPVTRRSRC